MEPIFLKTTEVGTSKEKLFEVLKETIEKNDIEIEDKVLHDVYLTACKAYNGKRRYSGEEYVTHPINVAILLAELGAGRDTVLAGLFCDVKEKGNDTNLANELPNGVLKIVRQIEHKNTEEAILIKLAERLHNMRTIDYIAESKKVGYIKVPQVDSPLTPLSGTAQKRKTSHPLPRTGICRHAGSQYFSRSGFQAQALYVWWKQDFHLRYVQAFR